MISYIIENHEFINLKRSFSTHCQVCGDAFITFKHETLAIVYFVPLDNNLVCRRCAMESKLEYEPRIYKEES